jgi:hypothetical protein
MPFFFFSFFARSQWCWVGCARSENPPRWERTPSPRRERHTHTNNTADVRVREEKDENGTRVRGKRRVECCSASFPTKQKMRARDVFSRACTLMQVPRVKTEGHAPDALHSKMRQINAKPRCVTKTKPRSERQNNAKEKQPTHDFTFPKEAMPTTNTNKPPDHNKHN